MSNFMTKLDKFLREKKLERTLKGEEKETAMIARNPHQGRKDFRMVELGRGEASFY